MTSLHHPTSATDRITFRLTEVPNNRILSIRWRFHSDKLWTATNDNLKVGLCITLCLDHLEAPLSLMIEEMSQVIRCYTLLVLRKFSRQYLLEVRKSIPF